MITATRDFVNKEIYPNLKELENNNYKLVEQIMKKAGELGLLGLNIPEKHVHIDTRKKDERSIWIIDENQKEIEVTPENRKKYIENKSEVTK